MTEIRDLSPRFVEEIFCRFDADTLTKEDRPIVRAMMEGYVLLGHAVREKNGKIHKLIRMIFGAKTEKTRTVLPGSLPKTKGEKRSSKGHGRNGASSYTGGRKETVSHASLKKGDACPGCRRGKVYPTAPGVTVRISGDAPLTATSFECEKLRCNLCGEVFTAVPDGGHKKYDATAGAMIALLKYGTGVPFSRLEQLEDALGIPLPASTQWDIGVSRQGRTTQPVQVRPGQTRLKPRSTGGAVTRKQHGETLRQHLLDGRCATLQVVTKVNAHVASSHATPVAETVDDARRQQGMPVTSRDTACPTGGVTAATWSEGWCGNWRDPRCPPKKPRREGPAYNLEREVAGRHQGVGSGHITCDPRAAKRAGREGPGPADVPFAHGKAGVR